MMAKILVIQTAFLGDAVLATAVLETIHRESPDAQISLLVRKGNEGLFTVHPFLHEVLVWDKQQHKYRNWLQLLFQIRKTRYDRVITLQRFASTGLWTAASGANFRAGFSQNPLSVFFTHRVRHKLSEASSSLHEVERNNQLLTSFVTGQPHLPKLYPSEADRLRVAPLTARPYLVIAPASVWFTKQYPPEKWIDFINALPASLQVYLIGGTGDHALAEKILRQNRQGSVQNLAGQLTLLQTAALQEKAVMNYVNDSAPLHMASAMNAPVTAVYCSTVPAFGFGPLSDIRFIIETPQKLSCRPCGSHGRSSCPLQHFHCAQTISVQQLLDTLPGKA